MFAENWSDTRNITSGMLTNHSIKSEQGNVSEILCSRYIIQITS